MAAQNTKPRVLLVGLGGIGGVITAHLVGLDARVTVVTRNPEVREALKHDGIQLWGDGEYRQVWATAVEKPPEDDEGYDYVLLATQPPQAKGAAESALASLKPNGRMVVFQNGLCEERVAEVVGEERVVGGIIAWGASMLGPGRYRRTSTGGFTLGRLKGPPDARLHVLAELLSPVGPVELTDNLRGARWSKLAINCAVSTLGTVAGERLGVLMRYGFVRHLALEVMTEVVEVAEAEGVELMPVAGTLNLHRLSLKQGEGRVGVSGRAWRHALMVAVGFRYRNLRSSMLRAIERGREPAVDDLNGEVTRRAPKHGLEVPVNLALQKVVHQIAAGEKVSSLKTLREVYDATCKR